jgi:hypothetical protein
VLALHLPRNFIGGDAAAAIKSARRASVRFHKGQAALAQEIFVI